MTLAPAGVRSSSMASGMTMLEVARAAGVPRTTVRFYDRAGLLPKPSRSRAGYRLFAEDAVVVVRFVKRAQELGFTLEELRSFVALSARQAPLGAAIAAAATRKVDEIDARVRDLRRMRRAIATLLAVGPSDGPCPILASLGGEVPSVCGKELPSRASSRRRAAG